MQPDTNSQGYESRDAQPRPVFIFLVAVTVISVLSGVLLAGVFHFLESSQRRKDAPASLVQDNLWKPPAIKLETHPSHSYEEYRAEMEEQLHTLSWIDPAKGRARIPVDLAMQMVARKGLPTREKNEAASAAGEAQS